MDGQFPGHSTFIVKIDIIQMSRLNHFQRQPVGIAQANSSCAKARRKRFTKNVVLVEARLPKTDGVLGNRETDHVHLSGSAAAAARSRPGEKSDSGSGLSRAIAKIEMIRGRVIKIDRPLSKTKPKQTRIEIYVPLRIAGDGGDMMDPAKLHSTRLTVSPLIWEASSSSYSDACICGIAQPAPIGGITTKVACAQPLR